MPRQNVEIQRGSLRLAEDRLRNGATTRLDVTQALSERRPDRGQHSSVWSPRGDKPSINCAFSWACRRRAWMRCWPGIAAFPTAPAQVAVGIPAELLRRRPDVRRAEREVAAQSALIGIATSELYPHFSINGTIFLDATKFEDLFDADSVGRQRRSRRSVGTSSTTDGWSTTSAFRKLAFSNWRCSTRTSCCRPTPRPRTPWSSFLKSQQQVQSLAQSADAARESVELVLSQYREGTVDFNRVFNVQQFLTQQQDQLAVAQGSVAQNLIQLYRALGGGWQIRLGNAGPQPFAAAEQPAEAAGSPAPAVPSALPPPAKQP